LTVIVKADRAARRRRKSGMAMQTLMRLASRGAQRLANGRAPGHFFPP
jgi:hypothetical protein